MPHCSNPSRTPTHTAPFSLSLSLSLYWSLSCLVTPARIFRLWYATRWWSRCARCRLPHTSSASLVPVPQIRRKQSTICWCLARRAMRVPSRWTGWMCPATSYSNHLWLWWVPRGAPSSSLPAPSTCNSIVIHLLAARYVEVVVTHETDCQRGRLDQAAQIYRGLRSGGLG